MSKYPVIVPRAVPAWCDTASRTSRAIFLQVDSAAVGSRVGELVGAGVGELDGAGCGELFGLGVGELVGTGVGELVGTGVGVLDGAGCGELFGLGVGELVGAGVGGLVGMGVGELAGAGAARDSTKNRASVVRRSIMDISCNIPSLRQCRRRPESARGSARKSASWTLRDSER